MFSTVGNSEPTPSLLSLGLQIETQLIKALECSYKPIQTVTKLYIGTTVGARSKNYQWRVYKNQGQFTLAQNLSLNSYKKHAADGARH